MKIINFVLFQLGWFAVVLTAAAGQPLWGIAAVLLIAVFHVVKAIRPTHEAKLLLCCLGLGVVWENILLISGWLTYAPGWPSGLAPLWIIMMWPLLGTSLNLSMSWLKGRYVLSAVLGAVSGPVAYLAGAKLGALELSQPTSALTALALGWAVLMPVLMMLADKFDGYNKGAK